MARQAEAERERRAMVINAEGERQAADRLAEAARIISDHPIALQLRYLQTLLEVAAQSKSTTLFPIPIDLFEPFLQSEENLEKVKKKAVAADCAPATRGAHLVIFPKGIPFGKLRVNSLPCCCTVRFHIPVEASKNKNGRRKVDRFLFLASPRVLAVYPCFSLRLIEHHNYLEFLPIRETPEAVAGTGKKSFT